LVAVAVEDVPAEDGAIRLTEQSAPVGRGDVTGERALVHNRTGGAGFQVCYGYNGVNCSDVIRGTGEFAPYDMRLINSVVLMR
jgi:hypothetical protein